MILEIYIHFVLYFLVTAMWNARSAAEEINTTRSRELKVAQKRRLAIYKKEALLSPVWPFLAAKIIYSFYLSFKMPKNDK